MTKKSVGVGDQMSFDSMVLAWAKAVCDQGSAEAYRCLGQVKQASLDDAYEAEAEIARAALISMYDDPEFVGFTSFVKTAADAKRAGISLIKLAEQALRHDYGQAEQSVVNGFKRAAHVVLETGDDLSVLAFEVPLSLAKQAAPDALQRERMRRAGQAGVQAPPWRPPANVGRNELSAIFPSRPETYVATPKAPGPSTLAFGDLVASNERAQQRARRELEALRADVNKEQARVEAAKSRIKEIDKNMPTNIAASAAVGGLAGLGIAGLGMYGGYKLYQHYNSDKDDSSKKRAFDESSLLFVRKKKG
jgi:hypothetical protein